VNIQLHVVTCPIYPNESIRDMLLHRLYYLIGCNCHTAVPGGRSSNWKSPAAARHMLSRWKCNVVNKS